MAVHCRHATIRFEDRCIGGFLRGLDDNLALLVLIDGLDGTETRLRCSTSAGVSSSLVLDAWVESSLPTTVADEFSSHAAAGTG
jgi:hypothetical protein